MSDPYASQQPEPSASTAPTIGLKHIFLWIAVSALLLAVNNAGNDSLRETMRAERFLIMSAWQALQAAVSGAGVTGFFILCSGTRRGRPRLRDPGHWMLFFLTWSIAISLLILRPIAWMGLPWVVFPAHLLIGCGLLCYIAWHNRGIWRVLFIIDAVFQLFGLGTMLISTSLRSNTVFSCLNVVISCVMVVTALLEGLNARRRRDWLHWLGILTVMFSIAATLFWWLAPMWGLFS